MRGEYITAGPREWAMRELPPRARRILSTGGMRSMLLGTTSACAENTAADLQVAALNRNYLRMRGEYGAWGV